MSTLRDKLDRRLSDLTDSALSKSEQGELLDAILATLTTEAREGSLPRELKEAARKLRDAELSVQVMGMSNANAGTEEQKLERRISYDLARRREFDAYLAYQTLLGTGSSHDQ